MNGEASRLAEAAVPSIRRPVALLGQYVVTCPDCGLLSAVHVDEAVWRVVRFVCPTRCAVDLEAVLSLVAEGHAPLTA